jgi:hypothetical protein
MPSCDKCRQSSPVLINVLGNMLCLKCEAQARLRTCRELRELYAMTEPEFQAWLAEEKRDDAQES